MLVITGGFLEINIRDYKNLGNKKQLSYKFFLTKCFSQLQTPNVNVFKLEKEKSFLKYLKTLSFLLKPLDNETKKNQNIVKLKNTTEIVDRQKACVSKKLV